MAMTLQMLRRFTAPLAKRIRLMVSRGVVKLVNDSLKCQGLQVQLLADELRSGVERFEDYGFTSHPYENAEVLYLSVGGNRSHGVAVRVFDRRYRPTDMDEGDVCLFTDDGERVYLDKSTDFVNLGAKAAADFIAQAQLTLDRLQQIATAYDQHIHATGTGPSGPPTGTGTPLGTITSVATTKVKAT